MNAGLKWRDDAKTVLHVTIDEAVNAVEIAELWVTVQTFLAQVPHPVNVIVTLNVGKVPAGTNNLLRKLHLNKHPNLANMLFAIPQPQVLQAVQSYLQTMAGDSFVENHIHFYETEQQALVASVHDSANS